VYLMNEDGKFDTSLNMAQSDTEIADEIRRNL
jgi:hypothetical protein